MLLTRRDSRCLPLNNHCNNNWLPKLELSAIFASLRSENSLLPCLLSYSFPVLSKTSIETYIKLTVDIKLKYSRYGVETIQSISQWNDNKSVTGSMQWRQKHPKWPPCLTSILPLPCTLLNHQDHRKDPSYCLPRRTSTKLKVVLFFNGKLSHQSNQECPYVCLFGSSETTTKLRLRL